jgi:N-succinyldiaminopimelate aminotransferase
LTSPHTAQRLRAFGGTIFAEMTALANERGAVNLGQGFPDFEGPPAIVDAAVAALRGGENQYARSMGVPPLVKAIADHQKRWYDLDVDPDTEVMVTNGCTEAIACALLGLLDPGDEVILFEPFYDSYPAVIAMAGATARYCTLRFPDFALDEDELRALFSDKTRAVMINTPHNPTGKVFTRDELQLIADLAAEHDAVLISDEVYEHLTYGDAEHIPTATVAPERTLTLSSTGKTYSFTGWKIGWATGPRELIAAAQSAHQFLTFSNARPLQVGMAHAIEHFDRAFMDELERDYTERRDFLLGVLEEAGFAPAVPKGTYFILADIRGLTDDDDRTFAKQLVDEVGVAAIPPSPFYAADPAEGARLLRFAFCKRMETLEAAAERLRRLVR